MKSTEVYAVAREVLAPWCKAQGFKRTESGVLGWYRPAGEGFLTFWLQCAQVGWDQYVGGEFTVEFQIAATAKPFALCQQRERFRELLAGEQLVTVRALQNSVIAKCVRPPEGYFIYDMGPRIVASYLRRFEPVADDDAMLLDPWLRFMDAGDVRAWAHFLDDALPGMLDRFDPASVAPDQRER